MRLVGIGRTGARLRSATSIPHAACVTRISGRLTWTSGWARWCCRCLSPT